MQASEAMGGNKGTARAPHQFYEISENLGQIFQADAPNVGNTKESTFKNLEERECWPPPHQELSGFPAFGGSQSSQAGR
jgi:hypothetical protein